MPQRTHSSLVHILLMWTAVLSVAQVAFIVLYFTAGRQNSEATSNMQIQPNITPPLPNELGLLLGKGKMQTFRATGASEDETKAKWEAKIPDGSLISEGEVLTVKRDGYYFLNLQVTLYSCDQAHAVSLMWNDKLLLKGSTHTNSCSTGLLSKVEELWAGGKLEVIVSPKTRINIEESETHFDIIYMHKP